MNKNLEVTFGNDSVVIRQFVGGIKGGKVLDTTGFTPEVIKAGHVIIRNTTTDVYKPMPLNDGGTAYASLPDSCEYVGVAVSTILTEEPLCAIMYSGEVNENAVPFSVASIKAAMKTAIPTLVFKHD